MTRRLEMICARAIGRFEVRGELDEIVALLRSGVPLTADCRRYLGDLIEYLGHMRKGGAGGAPTHPDVRRQQRNRIWGVALRMDEARRKGEKLTAVRAELAELMGVKDETIRALDRKWAIRREPTVDNQVALHVVRRDGGGAIW